MKTLVVLTAVLLAATLSHARSESFTCFDQRDVLPEPCGVGLNLYVDKGSCEAEDEIEGFYCATEEMTEIETQTSSGKILGVSELPTSNSVRVTLESGVYLAPRGMVKECKIAQIKTGYPKAAYEKRLSESFEYHLKPHIISYWCLEE